MTSSFVISVSRQPGYLSRRSGANTMQFAQLNVFSSFALGAALGSGTFLTGGAPMEAGGALTAGFGATAGALAFAASTCSVLSWNCTLAFAAGTADEDDDVPGGARYSSEVFAALPIDVTGVEVERRGSAEFSLALLDCSASFS